MKAVVVDRPESFRLADLPVPEAGPGQVRIKVDLAGVCGTDLHLHHGEFGPTYPLVPGHEFVGTVDAVGPGVELVRVGDRVVADTLIGCGACPQCHLGRTTSARMPQRWA